jgi:hypothetical protein
MSVFGFSLMRSHTVRPLTEASGADLALGLKFHRSGKKVCPS